MSKFVLFPFLVVAFLSASCGGGSGSGSGNNGGDTGPDGSGGNGTTISTDTTKRTNASYSSVTAANKTNTGMVDTVTETLDYYNSDGLASFSKDVPFGTSQQATLTVTEKPVADCPSGSIATKYTLTKELEVPQQEQKEDITSSLGQPISLDAFSSYILHVDATISGHCRGLNLVVTSEIESLY